MEIIKSKAVFRNLPLEQIEQDPDQPRKDFGVEGDQNRICESIKRYGIGDPIKVTQISENRYKIIDGHRRFIAAKNLRFTTIPCFVYPKMTDGEMEALRYELQNNRRNWKPLEKSNSLARIKSQFNIRTNKELAERLSLSITIVANSLQLRDQKLDYIELMEKYGLNQSYRTEFLRLRPKIQKVRDFEIEDIIVILFKKVKNNIIKNSHDLRKLGKIFLRTNANKSELHKFLSDPDMTITELDRHTLQSGFSLHIEQAIQSITAKRKDGVAFSSKEKSLLGQLKTLLSKVL